MVVRLVARHSGDQKFEVIGHALLRGRRGERCNNDRTCPLRSLYKGCAKVYHVAGTGHSRGQFFAHELLTDDRTP